MRKAYASREALERREDVALAPYAMRASRSRGRAVAEEPHLRRTAFQRDRDRIVHARAFRRLQYKTQVFVNDEGDHYRTRLTHTIEVAQIARTAARQLALNEDLVEAIALAHDLGHTPFGHSGGEALDECMKEHGGFEHNRQSLRVVDLLERRKDLRGLNLTYEVREGLAKHERFQPALSPLLEAQLVDVCDALAYGAHDIDDGLRSKLITPEDLAPLAIWGRANGSVSRIIDLAVTDLVDATIVRLETDGIDSVDGARQRPGYLVGYSARFAAERGELGAFLHERVYRNPIVVEVREMAMQMLRDLFRRYQAAPDRMPPEWVAWAAEPGVGLERAISDYIAGMTDRFARQEWERVA